MKSHLRRLIFWAYTLSSNFLRHIYPYETVTTVNGGVIFCFPDGDSSLGPVIFRPVQPHEDCKTTLTWQYVLDCRVNWDTIFGARHLAESAGYPYFVWEGRVYRTLLGEDTGVLAEDLK